MVKLCIELIQSTLFLYLLVFLYSFCIKLGNKSVFAAIRNGVVVSLVVVCAHNKVFCNINVIPAIFIITAIFFGWFSTFIVSIATICYFVFFQNSLLTINISMIIISFLFTTGYCLYKKNNINNPKFKVNEIYIVTLFLYGYAFVPYMFLGLESFLKILQTEFIPVLVIFPLSTALVYYFLRQGLYRLKLNINALQQSFLEHVVWNSDAVVVVLYDIAKEKLILTDPFYSFYGYSEKDLENKHISSICNAKDIEGESERYQALITGRINRYELNTRLYKHSGEMVYGHIDIRREDKSNLLIITITNNTEHYHLTNKLKQQQKLLQVTLDAGKLGIWSWNMQTNDVHRNQTSYNILTYPEIKPLLPSLPQDWIGAVHPDDLDLFNSLVGACIDGTTESFAFQYRIVNHNNVVRWVREFGKISLRDENNVPIIMSGVHRDITQQIYETKQLELMSEVFNSSNEAMAVIDDSFNYLRANDLFIKKVHLNFDYKGSSIYPIFDEIKSYFSDLNINWQEKMMLKLGDETLWFLLKVTKVISDTGHFYIMFLYDITEDRKAEQLIWEQAHYDLLTKIPNRRMLRGLLEKKIAPKDAIENVKFAIVFLNLKGFKLINDNLGHLVGDQVLINTTIRIKEQLIVEPGVVGRLSGDCFIIILDNIPRNFDGWSKDLIESVKKPMYIDEAKVTMQVNLGIATYPESSHNIDELLQYADQALHRAKKDNNSSWCYFSRKMQDKANRELIIMRDLKEAMQSDAIKILYKPIINRNFPNLSTLDTMLVWEHKTLGSIPMKEFSSIVIRMGFAEDFDEWLFINTIKQLALHNISKNIIVFINVLQIPKDIQKWLNLLQIAKISPEQICLTISESILVNVSDKMFENYSLAKKYNIKFCLDDFGDGYSSLSSLQKYNIDYLKIGSYFIKDLSNYNNKQILQTMFNIASDLNIEYIIKDVTTKEQFSHLKMLSCNLLQGSYIFKPLNLDEALVLEYKEVE